MKYLLYIFLLQSFGLGLHIPRREVLKIAPLLLVNQDEKIKVNICKDCKFFKKDFLSQTKFGLCSNFPYQQTDYYLVDGFKDTSPTSYYYCSTARSSDRMCGPEGKYFESK
jgi:hypothetical protein